MDRAHTKPLQRLASKPADSPKRPDESLESSPTVRRELTAALPAPIVPDPNANLNTAEEALQAILSASFAVAHANPEDLASAQEAFQEGLAMGDKALAMLTQGMSEPLHGKALQIAERIAGPSGEAMLTYSKGAHSASEKAEETGKPEDHYIAATMHMSAGMSHNQADEDCEGETPGHSEAWMAHHQAENYHQLKAGNAKVSPTAMRAAYDLHMKASNR